MALNGSKYVLLGPHHFHADKDPVSHVDSDSDPCFMIITFFYFIKMLLFYLVLRYRIRYGTVLYKMSNEVLLCRYRYITGIFSVY